jgi:hypothetical protein
MEIEIDRAESTSVLGRITGLLMIAFLAGLGVGCAPQPSSPNSVMIEMSRDGEVLKVTKADGTPIPRIENPYATRGMAPGGGKQFVLERCIFCVPGDGCWQIC